MPSGIGRRERLVGLFRQTALQPESWRNKTSALAGDRSNDTRQTKLAQGGEAAQYYSPPRFATPFLATPSRSIFPAVVIVAAVTVLLIYGIRESATTNTTIVLIKVAVVIFVIAFGSFMVHPANWQPFAPSGFGGIMGGRRDCFLCLHRFRCRLDHGGGNEESATRFADRHDRQPDHLHAALRAHVGRAHWH